MRLTSLLLPILFGLTLAMISIGGSTLPAPQDRPWVQPVEKVIPLVAPTTLPASISASRLQSEQASSFLRMLQCKIPVRKRGIPMERRIALVLKTLKIMEGGD